MEALESLCEILLRQAGYWVIPGIYVALNQRDKDFLDETVALPTLGKRVFKSFPRTQLDLVAYKPAKNELLIIECKSFLDSPGISARSFPFSRRVSLDRPVSREDVARFKQYKLFQHPEYLKVVSDQLIKNLKTLGMLTQDNHPSTRLMLACGRLADTSSAPIRDQFRHQGWRFAGPKTIVRGLSRLKNIGYHNDPIVMTAKLLLR